MLAAIRPAVIRLLALQAVAVLISAVACSKKDDAAAPPPAGNPAAVAPVAATPRTTPVDGAAIMAAATLGIKPFSPWPAAEGLLYAALGKPTWVDGDTLHWAVIEGDTCSYTYVKKEDRATYFKGEAPGTMMVGTTMPPMQVKRDGASMNWDECVKSTGQAPAAAPVEPAAVAAAAALDLSKPVALADLVAAYPAAKATLTGKPVQMTGLYLNATTAESGGTSSMTLSIVAAKGQLDPSVACMLARPMDQMLTQYAQVTVAGTVGKFLGGPSLEGCTVVASKPPAR